jgi:putative ABC transport system substrate-binding protein
MRRRDFIAAIGAAAITALPHSQTARARQANRLWRIGVLETVSAAMNTANFDAFRQGLKELGYSEGRDYVVEYRSVDGRPTRFPELAAELVGLRVDLIVTRGTPAARAAQQATTTIPIVMAAIGEALGAGVVASLARPGGNVTGLSAFVIELAGKRVELLRELIPGVARVGFLGNMSNPIVPPQWDITRDVARGLGIEAELLDVRNAEDITRAFETAQRQKLGALLVAIDAVTQALRLPIIEQAARARLPAIYAAREFVEAGGLLTYSVSYPHLYFRAARLVDKILKGARPGDLPVEQPTKLELIVNLKTARSIGLAIPEPLLARADEVIE